MNFATALRNVLASAGMSPGDIDTILGGEIKELTIERTCPAVATIGDGTALRAALIEQVTLAGGIFDPATDLWDLRTADIAPVLRLPATEECSAICRFGGTPTFDSAKALTNLLRLVKAAERP